MLKIEGQVLMLGLYQKWNLLKKFTLAIKDVDFASSFQQIFL